MPLEMGDIRSGIILTQLVRLADEILEADLDAWNNTGPIENSRALLKAGKEYFALRSALPKEI